MSQQTQTRTLGKPFYAFIGTFAFLATIGIQLYFDGVKGTTASPVALNGESVLEVSPSSPDISTNVVESAVVRKLAPMTTAEPEESRAFAIEGRVHSASGEAIEGAEVQIFLAQGDHRRELTRVTSDESGHYSSELDDLDDYSYDSLLSAFLETVVVADEYRPTTARTTFYGHRTNLTCNVALARGYSVRGRVVDPQGEPVRNAEVDLYLNTPPGTPRSQAKVSGATNESGEFLFGWPTGSGPRFLDAKHPQFGKLTMSLEHLKPSNDHALDDLALDPGGKLTGVVTCKEGGELLPGVRIEANPAGQERRMKRKWTETGPDGAFHLTGLIPGAYTLWVEDSPQPIGTWETGVDDIAIEVDLVRLVVSVRDPRDNPIPGTKIEFVNISDRGLEPLFEKTSATTSGRDAMVVFSPSQRFEEEAGETSPKLAVAMRATSVTLPTYEELVAIPKDACRIDHTFTLLPAEDFGRISVQVQAPGGGYLKDFDVILRSVTTGELIANAIDSNDDPVRWTSLVSPGEYRVHVRPDDFEDPQSTMLAMDYGKAVRIETGSEIELELPARDGGRIELTIDTEESPTIVRSALPSRVAEVTIAPIGQDSEMHEAPKLEVQGERGPTSEIAVRKTWTSTPPLEPGEYRLRVTCNGFATETVTLKVTKGQIVTQKVRMRPW